MKIAAALRDKKQGTWCGSVGRLACLDGRPGFIELVLPEEQGPKLRAGKGRAGGFEP